MQGRGERERERERAKGEKGIWWGQMYIAIYREIQDYHGKEREYIKVCFFVYAHLD